MKGKRKHPALRRGLWIAVCAALLLAGVCAWYLGDYYHAAEPALAALSASETVAVEAPRQGVTAFVPAQPTAGLVFYPGGKVEAAAYAPLLRALAEEGILCLLPEMPFRLAVLNRNAADGLIALYPQVERWYIGGHSLGGAMAASYLADHAADYEGLVLLAAFSTADLTGTTCRALSIYGTEDGVLNREKYAACQANLPEGWREVVLTGGCHAGFGDYGPQAGDGTPSLSPEAQRRQTVEAIVSWMGEEEAGAERNQKNGQKNLKN